MQTEIEALFDCPPDHYEKNHFDLFTEFLRSLNSGVIRAAEPSLDTPTGWRVNSWVKKGILLGFRMGSMAMLSRGASEQQFFDKSTYQLHPFKLEDGVRIVPGGSSIRTGCYVARGVVCMPPMYVNVGAYVDEGTMIDSHALVGSCAQIGKRVHLSAASQIGGVLEPIGASPVIIEDDVLIGGNCGVYEGVVIKKGAVLGSGTILNQSTPVYDLVNERVVCATNDVPLMIPENAVVVPGARKISSGKGSEWGISISTPIIVKYRDEKTDRRIQIEDLLR